MFSSRGSAAQRNEYNNVCANPREAPNRVTSLWGGAGLLLQTLSALSQYLCGQTKTLASKAPDLCVLLLLVLPSSSRANPARASGASSLLPSACREAAAQPQLGFQQEQCFGTVYWPYGLWRVSFPLPKNSGVGS